jgi:hypothetical protein
MTMVSSGPISLGGSATSGGLNQSINIELGQSATAQTSLNATNVRTLLAVPSGTISLSNAYGKSNVFVLTISSNQTNLNLRSLAVSSGWDQSLKVVATINAGIYVSSNSTGTPALTVNGSFPSGVELTNNGFIVGMGGAGGNGTSGNGSPGSAGGLALSVSSAITINNASGTVAGGGGGGGAGGAVDTVCGCTPINIPGGGGGGGRSSAAANSAGGANGGGAGTVSSAGAGGSGGANGGAGGNWGASGSNGNNGTYARGVGGAGGGAVSGNSNITWTAFGTRTGSIT